MKLQQEQFSRDSRQVCNAFITSEDLDTLAQGRFISTAVPDSNYSLYLRFSKADKGDYTPLQHITERNVFHVESLETISRNAVEQYFQTPGRKVHIDTAVPYEINFQFVG